MCHFSLSFILILLMTNIAYPLSPYLDSRLMISWKTINATGTIVSNDEEHYIYGCISQGPIGIIYDRTSLSPFGGIISGFWSSECDIYFSRPQQQPKDFFPLSNKELVFKLYQNFPNPFKKITHIRYDIPITCKVNISIYDISGRQIKQLVNEEQHIGQYSISWNKTDLNGEECSAGVYFISMKTENFKSIKKIVITK